MLQIPKADFTRIENESKEYVEGQKRKYGNIENSLEGKHKNDTTVIWAVESNST